MTNGDLEFAYQTTSKWVWNLFSLCKQMDFRFMLLLRRSCRCHTLRRSTRAQGPQGGQWWGEAVPAAGRVQGAAVDQTNVGSLHACADM